jgi:hypothetical protein
MDGARSATMDDQKDGHTVDVAVGQLRVEDFELEIELEAVFDVTGVLDSVRSVELDDMSVELEDDDNDGEVADAVLEIASGVSAVLDSTGAIEPDGESVALDEEAGVVLTAVLEVSVPEVELLALDVDEDADCTAQDDTAELEPAKYTFRRSAAPHVSAVFPRHGM